MKKNGDADISYQILRSRRATADIVLERDGRVLVRAPETVSDERIGNIVEAKRYWIYKNLAEWRDLNATRVLREYKSGEGFLYLGRSYRLSLAARQKVPLALKDGRFYLRRSLVDQGEMAAAKAAFRNFYANTGLKRIKQRVAYFAPKLGITPRNVVVRDLGNRWASCSPKGDLSFHWKCVMAPVTVLDYIVVHELCHFRHRDHTDAFWNEADKALPNYAERKEWLRKNGAGLDV
jgi:predicted metal-dependent hydrolase